MVSMMQFQQFIFLLVLMDGTGAGSAELFNNLTMSKQWPTASFDEGIAGNTSGHSADQLDFVADSPLQKIVDKVNAVIKSKLDELNHNLQSKLKAKDPATINVKRKMVEFNEIWGISTLHIKAFEIKAIEPPVMTFRMSGMWDKMKLAGRRKRMRFAIDLKRTSFDADQITAHFDSTFAIQKFEVTEIHANLGASQVKIGRPGSQRFRNFRRWLGRIVTRKLHKKKHEIGDKLALKIKDILEKVLNGMKGEINKKIHQVIR